MVLEIINAVIVTVGVPSLIVGLIYVGKKLQSLETLETTVEKIKVNLKIVSDHLMDDDGFNHSELQTYSPLMLTKEGEELLENLGFKQVFEDHKSDFYECIKEEKPKQKHDVELASIRSIYVLQDKDYMNFLKKFFYNNPGRNLSNTAPTLGVYIRDKYLEEHPEISE